jgi:hypothetical protein
MPGRFPYFHDVHVKSDFMQLTGEDRHDVIPRIYATLILRGSHGITWRFRN